MCNHGTAVLDRPTEAALPDIKGVNANDSQLAGSESELARELAASSFLLEPGETQELLSASKSCQDCNGTGFMRDSDGSLTSMTGWPIPCYCTDDMPATARQAWLRDILNAIPPMREGKMTAPLSRSGL
jgi:hypothetical protein